MLHPYWDTSPSPSLRCCIIETRHSHSHWDTVPSNNLQPRRHIPIPVLFCEVRCFRRFARWVSEYPTKALKAPHLRHNTGYRVSGIVTGDTGYPVYRYWDISAMSKLIYNTRINWIIGTLSRDWTMTVWIWTNDSLNPNVKFTRHCAIRSIHPQL